MILVLSAVASTGCGSGPTTRGGSAGPSGGGPLATASRDASAAVGPDGELSELIAAARAEGSLNTIGLDRDRCGYGTAIDTFARKYNVAVTELSPGATSADQLAALAATRSNPASAPDVIDVSPAVAERAKADGSIAAFQIANGATIPAAARDPDGFWYGGHFAVVAFETNGDWRPTPPADWPDLLTGSRADRFALAGDPTSDPQAIATVYAAALANHGGPDDAGPGLEFFRKMADAGALDDRIAGAASIDSGLTPLTARWSDAALAHRDATAGQPKIDVTIPESGRLAMTTALAINSAAPHPNAAKLWLEFLTSDEGQSLFLDGNCHPIRLDDLVARGVIPVDLLADLPDVAGAVFPSAAQLAAATDTIVKGWAATVGVDIR
jgi:putative spermidine/putrescine transport system substrate-binding protein